jgi:hypothetical protein
LLGELGFLLGGEGVGTVLDEPARHFDYLWMVVVYGSDGWVLWMIVGDC